MTHNYKNLCIRFVYVVSILFAYYGASHAKTNLNTYTNTNYFIEQLPTLYPEQKLFMSVGPAYSTYNFTNYQNDYSFGLKNTPLIGVKFDMVVNMNEEWYSQYTIQIKTTSTEFMPWLRPDFSNFSSLAFSFFRIKTEGQSFLQLKTMLRNFEIDGRINPGISSRSSVTFNNTQRFGIKDYRIGPDWVISYPYFQLHTYVYYSNQIYTGYKIIGNQNFMKIGKQNKYINSIGGSFSALFTQPLSKKWQAIGFAEIEYMQHGVPIGGGFGFIYHITDHIWYKAVADASLFQSFQIKTNNFHYIERGITTGGQMVLGIRL